MKLKTEDRNIIIAQAKIGGTPDWYADSRPVILPRAGRGRRGILIERAYVDGIEISWCPILIMYSEGEVESARRHYDRWHRLLCLLALALAGSPFKLWKICGPAAPAAPWSEIMTKGT